MNRKALLSQLIVFLLQAGFIAAAIAADSKSPPSSKSITVSTPTAVQPQNMSSSSIQQSALSSPILDKWALVVGISKFADSSLNLKYASKDARDFYDYLTKEANFAPDHVKLLIDEDATREAILDMFGDKWLPHAALPGDLVVIYISSHGSPAGLDAADVNYIVAHNTDTERLFSTGVSLPELIQLIKKRVHSDRIIAILDTCFSGAAGADSKSVFRPSNVNAETIAQGTGQLVICSSEPTQTSWESKDYANGVFTRQLIEGLRLHGNKSTLEEAFQYMKEKVQEEVVRDRGALQSPVLKSKWQGEKLVLSVPATKPRKAPYLPLPGSSLASSSFTKQSSESKQPLVRTTQEPELSWAVWISSMQHAKQLIENDEEKEGKKQIASASAERAKLGLDDPRVFIEKARSGGLELLERETPLALASATLRAFNESAQKAYDNGDLLQAESAFRKALNECDNSRSSELCKAACLDGIGLSLLYQGKLKDAEDSMRQCRNVDRAGNHQFPKQEALHLEHLAAILYIKGEYEEAALAVKQAMSIWEQELGVNHPQLASTLNLLGVIAKQKKNYADAELLFKQALDIDEKAAWFAGPDKSQAFFNLALLNSVQSKYKEADSLFKKALSAREHQFGSDSPAIPGILVSLAENSSSLGKNLEAESSLKRALSLEKKQLPTESPFLLCTAKALLKLYKAQQKTLKIDELSREYPAVDKLENQDELRKLLELSPQKLNAPGKIGNVWNVHATDEKLGDLYGKWTWQSGAKQFLAAWDNGTTGTLKFSRYDSKGLAVMHYLQAIPEESGNFHVREFKVDGISGSTAFYDLIGTNGKWEAFWQR